MWERLHIGEDVEQVLEQSLEGVVLDLYGEALEVHLGQLEKPQFFISDLPSYLLAHHVGGASV